MTPRQRKPWSKVIEESGISVRVYERAPGSLLYREIRLESAKDRKSLGHRDRPLAEQQARELARRVAELRLTGHTGSVTFGQLWRLYQEHRGPLLTVRRARLTRELAGYFLEHLGDGFALENLSQSHIDAYAVARKSGAIGDKRRPVRVRGVRDGTVRGELVWLASVMNFGRGFKVNGRSLLPANPMHGLTLPKERNIRRPVASEERYRLTLAKADEADPTGRFACMLALVRYTGRRINSVCQLRASDVLLSPDAVSRALAAIGQDPGLARHMPHGALRWRAEHDKQGFEDIAPISAPAKAALERYLRTHPKVGDAWMFPQPKKPSRSTTTLDARKLRIRAETLAELPVVERGGFHSYRRLWAVERKHLPDVDVARGGGWRDLASMKRSYQQPDPATTLRVIENEQPAEEPAKRSGEGSA